MFVKANCLSLRKIKPNKIKYYTRSIANIKNREAEKLKRIYINKIFERIIVKNYNGKAKNQEVHHISSLMSYFVYISSY